MWIKYTRIVLTNTCAPRISYVCVCGIIEIKESNYSKYDHDAFEQHGNNNNISSTTETWIDVCVFSYHSFFFHIPFVYFKHGETKRFTYKSFGLFVCNHDKA